MYRNDEEDMRVSCIRTNSKQKAQKNRGCHEGGVTGSDRHRSYPTERENSSDCLAYLMASDICGVFEEDGIRPNRNQIPAACSGGLIEPARNPLTSSQGMQEPPHMAPRVGLETCPSHKN